jgi:hypothetical protein
MRTIARNRSLHLIDVENLYAAHHEAPYEPWFGDLYWEVVGRGPTDLAIVGADRSHALEIDAVFPGARKLWGFGPDGADRQLLDAVDWPALARGCTTLVIASGDGCFVDAAYRARQRDIRVVVVSRAESLSGYLASYADAVIEFPDFDPGAPPEFVTAA